VAILGRGQTKITEGVAALDGGSVVSKGAWDGVLYFWVISRRSGKQVCGYLSVRKGDDLRSFYFGIITL
jgi:hypothetical protein